MATQALSDISAVIKQIELFKQPNLSIRSLDSISSSSDIIDVRSKRNDSAILTFDEPRFKRELSDSESELSLPTSSPSLSATESELENLEDESISIQDLKPAAIPRLGRKVAVIGVGYVGLHLVEEFGKRHNVTAFDISPARISAITPGLQDLPMVKPTSNESDLAGQEFYMISVPTLVRPDETVDTSYLESAIAKIEKHARPGATIIIESSVAVGMTRSLLGPLCVSKNLKAGMSPERVDPGRVRPFAYEIPKIISGLDDVAPGSLASIHALYSTTFDTVVPVSKPEVAEMTKLYENCQRMINIAYVNEMADACIPFSIDPFEVCRAAESKPFGYAAYRPSAGVGGHCIPVNPYYLFSGGQDWSLLNHATQTMNYRPASIADRVMRNLYKRRRLSITQRHTQLNPHVLVVGVGFKPGQSVLSNSPGVAMMKALRENWDADVCFADPLVSKVKGFEKMDDCAWNAEKLAGFDAIVVVMEQQGLDFEVLEKVACEGALVHYCCR